MQQLIKILMINMTKFIIYYLFFRKNKSIAYLIIIQNVLLIPKSYEIKIARF